jgi:hypothetical protein
MEHRDTPNPGRETDLSKAQNQQQPTGQAQQQQPTDQAQPAPFGQAQQQQPEASQSQQSEYGQSQQPSSNADVAVGQSDTVTEQRADIEGGTATGQASDVEGSSFVGSKSASDESGKLVEDDESTDFSRDGQGAAE